MKYPRIAEDRSQLEAFAEDVEKDNGALTQRVGDLETAVGDEDSGLVKQVADLEDKTDNISYDPDVGFDIVNNVEFENMVDIDEDLTVSGDTSLQKLNVNGNAEFVSNAVFDGLVDVENNYVFNGSGEFDAAVTFNGDVDFSNANPIGLSVGTKLYKHVAIVETGSNTSSLTFYSTDNRDISSVSFTSVEILGVWQFGGALTGKGIQLSFSFGPQGSLSLTDIAGTSYSLSITSDTVTPL